MVTQALDGNSAALSKSNVSGSARPIAKFIANSLNRIKHPFSRSRKQAPSAFEVKKPEPEQTKQYIESLSELLERGTGLHFVSIFRDSPLKDSRLEASILQIFVREAYEQKVGLSQVELDASVLSASGVSETNWKDYIQNFASSESKSGISKHLLVTDEGKLKPSADLAAFMKEKISFLPGTENL